MCLYSTHPIPIQFHSILLVQNNDIVDTDEPPPDYKQTETYMT